MVAHVTSTYTTPKRNNLNTLENAFNLIVQMPLFVANITIGLKLDSNARLRKVKHSISSI